MSSRGQRLLQFLGFLLIGIGVVKDNRNGSVFVSDSERNSVPEDFLGKSSRCCSYSQSLMEVADQLIS